MFGMSSEEFWEESPQLYWAYRLFYLKKLSVDHENEKYLCWLQGNINSQALSIAINNTFGSKKIEYPSYEEMFDNKSKSKEENKKKLTPKEEKNRINLKVQEEFNSCARF